MVRYELVRILVTLALAFEIAGSAGCASLDKMAHDQDVYNQNRCQQFGLTPGSPQYVQCVSQGANAYAAAQKNATTAPAATAAWPAVVAVAPSRCSAAADADNVCAGCSVSCPSGQQASCTEGEVHKTDGFSPVCWTKSKCECR